MSFSSKILLVFISSVLLSMAAYSDDYDIFFGAADEGINMANDIDSMNDEITREQLYIEARNRGISTKKITSYVGGGASLLAGPALSGAGAYAALALLSIRAGTEARIPSAEFRFPVASIIAGSALLSIGGSLVWNATTLKYENIESTADAALEKNLNMISNHLHLSGKDAAKLKSLILKKLEKGEAVHIPSLIESAGIKNKTMIALELLAASRSSKPQTTHEDDKAAMLESFEFIKLYAELTLKTKDPSSSDAQNLNEILDRSNELIAVII